MTVGEPRSKVVSVLITCHDRDQIKSASSHPILKYQSRNNQSMYSLIMSDTDGRCSVRQYPSSCSQCIPSPHHQIILRLAYHYCRLLIEIRVNTFTELSSRTILANHHEPWFKAWSTTKCPPHGWSCNWTWTMIQTAYMEEDTNQGR